MVVMREDFGDQTYWRIFLRARYQDGSAGAPLHTLPWDFSTRYSGDTDAYERGGSFSQSIPPGYWVDFTHLAAVFGWERLPALPVWKASYPASRFNEFVLTNGLDWRSAMLEILPAEALITPSPVVPPTRTLTPTPRWYQSPTPTPTPTLRPTLTLVLPTGTPSSTLTRTPLATLNRLPSLTPTPSITPLDGAVTSTATVSP
jgi:TolB protein